ncbi:MAG: hypothetical protein K6357_04880 [Elusimicrobiota bacterium]
MTGIIVVTHSDFGAYLLEACEHVVGVKEGVVSVSINSRMSIDEAHASVKKATDDLRKVTDSIVFFVDIPGGTPMNVVLPFAKEIGKAAVICGINMPMLITALNLKDKMDFDSLIEKIMIDGRRAICEVKSILTRDIREDLNKL